jgi:hypothetical protein
MTLKSPPETARMENHLLRKLHHAPHIWRGLRKRQVEAADVHAKLMRSYASVPPWYVQSQCSHTSHLIFEVGGFPFWRSQVDSSVDLSLAQPSPDMRCMMQESMNDYCSRKGECDGVSYAYMPISTGAIMDRYGKPYNITSILRQTSVWELDEEAYHAYSPIFISASFSITYAVAFALSTAVIVHTLLHHAPPHTEV